jgi:hypothetical protein
MSSQLWALAVAGLVVLAAVGLEMYRSRRAQSRVVGVIAEPASDPYILYFTGENCSVCKTHQEPALARLDGVRIDKVDAVADRSLADRFHVYTLPTTVVMAPDGHAVHVNYGYAAAPKLQRQLSDAGLSQAATA